jgi:ABC-type molybdenum transport system ATPase subunit/photorepair protein PhrA
LEYDPLINWEIKRGEQWAVVGLNGAGKTFLADFICGKYAVREGENQLWLLVGREGS